MSNTLKVTNYYGEYEYTLKELLKQIENDSNFFSNVEFEDYDESFFKEVIQSDIDKVKSCNLSDTTNLKLHINQINEDLFDKFTDQMKIDMLVYSNNPSLKWINEEEIILKAIQQDPKVINKIENEFLDDKEFMEKAILMNPKVFEVCFDRLSNNIELSSLAMKCDGELIGCYSNDRMIPSSHNVKNALLNNSSAIDSIKNKLPLELEHLVYEQTKNIADLKNPSSKIREYYKETGGLWDNERKSAEPEHISRLLEYFDYNRRLNWVDTQISKYELIKKVELDLTNPNQEIIKECNKEIKSKTNYKNKLMIEIDNSKLIDKDKLFASMELSFKNGNTIGFSNIDSISKNSNDSFNNEIKLLDDLENEIEKSNFKEITEEDLSKINEDKEESEVKILKPKTSLFSRIFGKKEETKKPSIEERLANLDKKQSDTDSLNVVKYQKEDKSSKEKTSKSNKQR